jgi:hypothetical protein
MIEPDSVQREAVLRLAARGVAPDLVHVLLGKPYNMKQFLRLFRAELAEGAALADAAVTESLFELASAGKSVQASLAWARQRLGWSVSDDTGQQNANKSGSGYGEALAAFQTLMEQLASAKAGGASGADAVAGAGAAQPVAPAG